MWNDTAFTRRFGLRYPIVQGPFGGGLSSTGLAATVSNAGGLGSFGLQGMTPEKIRAVVAELRTLTAAPFAVNLWVSTKDAPLSAITPDAFAAAVASLAPLYSELQVAPPSFPPPHPRFDDQVAAVIEARPPIFSFIFGVPSPAVLEACRSRGILTLGTATTVDEARALADAGVDAIVATGSEAGGHRPSFLRSAEASLTGTLSLVPPVVDAVRVPVIAAGGVGDGRGLAAVLALGAGAAQIGTAFLACEESNAPAGHRAALWEKPPVGTMLTRGLTGRLGRALHNRLVEAVSDPGLSRLPYPYQGHLISTIKQEALTRERFELAPFWSGQATSLIRHRRAAELFAALVDEAASFQF